MGVPAYRPFVEEKDCTSRQLVDSNIWTPSINGFIHHIFYANAGIATSEPFVDLDVDDVTSDGPEHITVWEPYAGTYIYAVYHYGGSGDITTSEAQVTALRPDGTVENFNVPDGSAGANWWWHVCTVDGETGVITPVNSISADPPTPVFLPPMPPKVGIEYELPQKIDWVDSVRRYREIFESHGLRTTVVGVD